MNIQLSGTETNKGIGQRETYHAPLRRIYSKILEGTPDFNQLLALPLAVKEINETSGHHGLVLWTLVFGLYPRLDLVTSSVHIHSQRMGAIRKARTEMSTIIAQRRIAKALSSQVPAATEFVLYPGLDVLTRREHSKKLHIPALMIDVNGKLVTLTMDNKLQQYIITQIIPKPTVTKLPQLPKLQELLRKHNPDGIQRPEHINHAADTVPITETIHP